jgi:hypothetical protein
MDTHERFSGAGPGRFCHVNVLERLRGFEQQCFHGNPSVRPLVRLVEIR